MRTISVASPQGIVAFAAVVQHGSFRAASRALGVPTSTLSQQVGALERHLGALLLARTTRSVRLTDVGASYYREVVPALDALRAAEARVADLQAAPRGHLRMTAPFELGQRLVGPLLADYGARFPDVRVTLDLLDRHVSLVEEGYDLAIRVGPLDDSGLIARRVGGVQRLGLWASPAYLKRNGTPKEPRDLSTHRCLVMTGARQPTSWAFVRGRKRITVPVEPHFGVNSFVALADLAASGLGIARLPEQYARRVGGGGSLREVLKAYAPPGRQCFALYPSARHVSPAVREMVETLARHLDRMDER